MLHIIQRQFEHQNKPPASAHWQLRHNLIQISCEIYILDLTRGLLESLNMGQLLDLVQLEKRF